LVSPVCSNLGWVWNTMCKPDCSLLGDVSSCDATPGCAWASTCDISAEKLSGCFPFPFTFQGCSANPCPAGQTCHDVPVDPADLHSTNCTGVYAKVSICSQ